MTCPQHVYISVNHHHRVVDYHTQHDYEGGKGNGVELKTNEIHDSDGGGDADGHRRGTHDSSAQREQHQHHQDDHQNGLDKVLEERLHRRIHHPWLIRDAVDMDVGRRLLFELRDNLLHLLSKLHHIVSAPHLEREHDATMAVGRRVAVANRRQVLAVAWLNGGHVPQPQRLPRHRVREDNHVVQVMQATKGYRHMHHRAAFVVRHLARDGAEALCRQLGRHNRGRDGILRQFHRIHVDRYFLLLVAHHVDFSQLGDTAQACRKFLRSLLQLAWRPFLTLHRQKQRRRVAKVIYHRRRHHSLRQVRDAEEGHSLADARPCNFRVPVAMHHRHKHIQHSILTVGVGLRLVHLVESEKIILHLRGHLFLYLLCRRTGIHHGHHSLPDSDIGKLVLLQMRQRIHPYQHHRHQRQRQNGEATHRPFYHIRPSRHNPENSLF